MEASGSQPTKRDGELVTRTVHEWVCLTPGCKHRTPPAYATSLDCHRAALHHVRWTGHRVRIELHSITAAVYAPSDADDWRAS